MSFAAAISVALGLNSDPRLMPASQVQSPKLLYGADDSTTAAFWTAVGNQGTTATVTDGVQATIVNISGSGFVSHLISAELASTGTAAWVITIDGVTYTFTHTSSGSNAERFVMGALRMNTVYTTAANGGDITVSTNLTARGGTNVVARYTDSFQIDQPHIAPLPNLLRFQSSLLVKGTFTTLGASGTNKTTAGVVHRLAT